jgi:hypothetical protein
MAIKVDLNPDDESRLAHEARTHGVRPEKYAQDLLLAALHGVRPKDEYDPVLDSVGAPETETGALTVEQFHALLDSLAEGAENLPDLATESFTRESFYEDRNITGDA